MKIVIVYVMFLMRTSCSILPYGRYPFYRYRIGKFSATADVLFTTAQVLNILAVSSHMTFIMLNFSENFCKSFYFQLKSWR